MVCIYKITSPNNKIYIGQTWNLKSRIPQYSSLNCKRQVCLYNSLKKYGWEEHILEIMYVFPKDIEQSVLDNYEFFYWSQYLKNNYKMLNLREPGNGKKHSEETKQKMRKPKKTSKKGYKYTEEQKSRMRKPKPITSQKMKGYKFSEERNKKLRKSNIKNINKTVYILKNRINNNIFIGNQQEFIKKFDYHQGSVNNLVKGRSKSYKNWIKVLNNETL